ncbi:MAG TPA: riboflavin synthase [Planctomycetota bacterium]|nr:riboflavin synthase [Planctomycetota bacterium]
MFSGIIECACPVAGIREAGGARRLTLDLSPLRGARPGGAAGALVEPGGSVSVNGCCLTVDACDGDRAAFEVVAESLARTNLGALSAGDRVNVERSLRFGDPVDGHLVSGHVECTGLVTALDERPGDTRLRVRCGPGFAALLLPKGSVAIDGVSLTLAALGEQDLEVALVPHTLGRTTLGERRPGDRVNLEPDLIGRWILAAVARLRA